MIEEVLNEFYLEYEDSYIDANTHGVIVKLIEELQESGLLLNEEINWDNIGENKKLK